MVTASERQENRNGVSECGHVLRIKSAAANDLCGALAFGGTRIHGRIGLPGSSQERGRLPVVGESKGSHLAVSA